MTDKTKIIIVLITIIGCYISTRQPATAHQTQPIGEYRTLANGTRVEFSAPTVLDTIAEIEVARKKVLKEYKSRMLANK